MSPLSVGAVGATGTRTVTRTLASVVATISLSRQMKIGRAGGRYSLSTVGWNLTNAVNRHGGGVLRAPVQHDGLAQIDGSGVSRQGRGRRSDG